MLAVRDAVPRTHHLSNAEFATLRLRLLKLGARVIETASRIRLAFAAACSEADLFRRIAVALSPCNPRHHSQRGNDAPRTQASTPSAFLKSRPSRGEKDATILHDQPTTIAQATQLMN